MRRLALFLFISAALHAADNDPRSREFDQPCMSVFPATAHMMTGLHWEPTVSDSAGGLLTLKYTGEPMIYSFFVRKADPYLAKYTVNPKKRRHQGLTLTTATFTFHDTEGGCRVDASVGLAVIDLKSGRDASGANVWLRVPSSIESNGAAESQMLEGISLAMKEDGAVH